MCLLLTGAEVEGSTIPEAVSVEGVMPETQEATGTATGPAEIAGGEAPGWPKRCATMCCRSQAWR
jgi:hypothetical protein